MTRRHCGVADPLFLSCCALYVANRWLVKPHLSGAVFHDWFNDLLLIPCALPPLLLVHRWLGLRDHDGPPAWREVAAHLAGWSLLFEFAGPRLLGLGTGDPWDVIAYSTGALVALFSWGGKRAGFRLPAASTYRTTPQCQPS